MERKISKFMSPFQAEEAHKSIPDGWHEFTIIGAKRIPGKTVPFLLELTIEDEGEMIMRHRIPLTEGGMSCLYTFWVACGLHLDTFSMDCPWVLLTGKVFYGNVEHNDIGPRLTHWRRNHPDDAVESEC
jgi:hypothetical protein